MSNLAYDLNAFAETETTAAPGAGSQSDACAACGEPLFGDGARGSSWQSWATFWEVFGSGHVELVCGACGEYLRGFFNGRA